MTATSAAGNAALEQKDRALVIERVFQAPRELVWAAFTRPEHLLKWMGPRHHPAIRFDADVRPGGRWSGTLRALDGSRELRQGGMFHEVIPPERLIYTFGWEDHPEGSDFETLITINFIDLGGETLMKFHQARFNTNANRDGHIAGWTSAFDRLDDFLAATA